MKIWPTVIVDSREQNAFDFSLPVEIGTLTTGDYSVRGLEHLVAVERKSLPDLLGCLGQGRDRFIRELQRLRAYRFRLIIIESTPDEIDAGQWRSTLKPSHVWGSIASWTARYALPFHLGGTHAQAGRFCERFLIQSARHICEDYRAAAGILETAKEVGCA